jgi:hypothetical protein
MNRPPVKTPPERASRPHPMVAGSFLVTTILLCAAVGLGLGALVGIPIVGLFGGLFVGFPLGVVVVRARYRDL